jgi:hypothetical protein
MRSRSVALLVGLLSAACGGRVEGGEVAPEAAPTTTNAPPTPAVGDATGSDAPVDPPIPAPVTRTTRGYVRLQSSATGERFVHPLADAHFYAPSTWTEVWGCTERDDDNVPLPSGVGSLDAGTVTLTFASPALKPVTLHRPEQGLRYSPTVQGWADAWTSRNEGVDTPITFDVSGGADVPAFSAVARSAHAMTFQGLPAEDAILPSADLVFTWSETGNDDVEAILYSGEHIVFCKMPGSSRRMTIPADMVERVRTKPGDYGTFRGLLVISARRSRIVVGGAEIEVISEERTDRMLRTTTK